MLALILLIAAIVAFGLAAISVPTGRINLVAVGLLALAVRMLL